MHRFIIICSEYPETRRTCGYETVTQLNLWIQRHVEYYFRDQCRYFLPRAVLFFLQIGDTIRYFKVSSLSFRETRRFVVIRGSRCPNLGLSFRVFLGSEFSGLSFRDTQGGVSKTQTLRKLDNFERFLQL